MIGKIIIENLRGRQHLFRQSLQPLSLYIGREYVNRKSGKRLAAFPLANPFPLLHEKDREKVFADYKNWLYEEIYFKNYQVLEAVSLIEMSVLNGENVRLWCWCAPLLCHGNAISDIIMERIKNGSPDL